METMDCPKCEHEHEPAGIHEDDAGEMSCESCGFRFRVEIEYTPSYLTHCVEHEFGEWGLKADLSGELVRCRFCTHCQMCQVDFGEESLHGENNDG